ncbi:MAG TPA: ion channel [Stellaceae bacterium]|nr:ion channel [Stellaceae bacterium]
MAKAAKRTKLRAQARTHVIRVGLREIETQGLADGFWTDLYHRALIVYWPVFFATAAAIFIVLNAVFAFLFWLGHGPIANTNPAIPLPLNLFYFSIETLATVGYGDMHPQTDYGHLVATVEIFTGMSFLAVMTGLIFARFSRPRARFIFARNPIVGRHLGKETLMIRVANERHNTISQATARLWLLRIEQSEDGAQLRRFYELKLERGEHPMFALSWTLFHAIDKASPLHGVTAADLARTDGAFVLNLSGVDDNSAQHLYARHIYSHKDIRWNHRYRDITAYSDEGRLLIDYSLFHDVLPEEA